ncbi:hypothetical protein E3P99_01844 [Wallemia hederae]|uniref:Uncharacterized protein n=1 Tax=Wallemia hederae TaxID=1540922 RepID=A0A4T0FSR4_9BASI|nr:hypothetical protein E3P99_01844 [Wallemia hederae]
MSKSKYDLIVRTRYQNQIPPPNFGPKLLNIEPNLQRLGEYEFTANLVAEQPHPMLVDAESGMPLQLQHFAELWDEQDQEDEHLELNPEADAELDSEDLALLIDPSDVTTRGTALNSGSSTPDRSSQASNKAWLYKSKYSNASDPKEKRINYSKAALTRKQSQDVKVFDDTPEGRAQEIESTFIRDQNEQLDDIRHPQKKHLKAVDTFDFLPDFETFANNYFLMRFADDPSDRSTSTDHRLHNGILRPRDADQGDGYLQYYLPENDEQYALLRSKLEADALPQDVDEQDRVLFNYVREYNITNQVKDTNDMLLMFDNGDGKAPGSAIINPSLASARPRGKGVYYKKMPTRMTLKKRRPKDEEDQDKWDKIQLGLEPLTEEEVNERMVLEKYFMPGGPKEARKKKAQQDQLQEAAKEEEKLRIKAEKIQQKQEAERERKALREEQMRREEEEKMAATAAKSEESDDEDFGDDDDKKSEGEDASDGEKGEKEQDKEPSQSPAPGSEDNEHDKVSSEAASREIDEAIRREIDQQQTSTAEKEDVEMRSASPEGVEEHKDADTDKADSTQEKAVAGVEQGEADKPIEPQPEPQPEAQPESQPESQPQPVQEATSVAAERPADSQSVSQPDVQPESHPEPQAESQQAPEPEPQPETQSQQEAKPTSPAAEVPAEKPEESGEPAEPQPEPPAQSESQPEPDAERADVEKADDERADAEKAASPTSGKDEEQKRSEPDEESRVEDAGSDVKEAGDKPSEEKAQEDGQGAVKETESVSDVKDATVTATAAATTTAPDSAAAEEPHQNES